MDQAQITCENDFYSTSKRFLSLDFIFNSRPSPKLNTQGKGTEVCYLMTTMPRLCSTLLCGWLCYLEL